MALGHGYALKREEDTLHLWPSGSFFLGAKNISKPNWIVNLGAQPVPLDENHPYAAKPTKTINIIMHILRILFVQALILFSVQAAEKGNWKRHVVWEGLHNNVAVAADFTGDGKVDVISNAGGKTRLFIAPGWKEVIIGDHKDCLLYTSDAADE